jgi:hypothetical protein
LSSINKNHQLLYSTLHSNSINTTNNNTTNNNTTNNGSDNGESDSDSNTNTNYYNYTHFNNENNSNENIVLKKLINELIKINEKYLKNNELKLNQMKQLNKNYFLYYSIVSSNTNLLQINHLTGNGNNNNNNNNNKNNNKNKNNNNNNSMIGKSCIFLFYYIEKVKLYNNRREKIETYPKIHQCKLIVPTKFTGNCIHEVIIKDKVFDPTNYTTRYFNYLYGSNKCYQLMGMEAGRSSQSQAPPKPPPIPSDSSPILSTNSSTTYHHSSCQIL